MTLKEMSAILNNIVEKCSPDMDFELITDENPTSETLDFESVTVVNKDGVIVDICSVDDPIPDLSDKNKYIWLNTSIVY